MKKGFTLVELLVTIVLIALLAAIALPSGIKIKKTINNSMLDSKIKLIESGAIEWGQNNKNDIFEGVDACSIEEITTDPKVSHCIRKSIHDLLSENVLEEDKLDDAGKKILVNPISNKPLTDCSVEIYIKNKRVYARYDAIGEKCGYDKSYKKSRFKITLNNEDVTENTIYLGYGVGYYNNRDDKNTITSVSVPSKLNYQFLGYYTSPSGGEQIIDSTGAILVDNKKFDRDTILYARWDLLKYEITLINGDVTENTIYLGYGVGYYNNRDDKNAITSVSVPSKLNYQFLGYYTSPSGGEQIIDSFGNIIGNDTAFDSDVTLYANWSLSTYVVNLCGVNYTVFANQTSNLSLLVNGNYTLIAYEDGIDSCDMIINKASNGVNKVKVNMEIYFFYDGWYSALAGKCYATYLLKYNNRYIHNFSEEYDRVGDSGIYLNYSDNYYFDTNGKIIFNHSVKNDNGYKVIIQNIRLTINEVS